MDPLGVYGVVVEFLGVESTLFFELHCYMLFVTCYLES